MAYEMISSVGRMVQGSVSLEPKIDTVTKQQKRDPETGQGIVECFIALAVPKMVTNPQTGQLMPNPELANMYAAIDAVARAEFPWLFPNGGPCIHQEFAWKIKDGDGVTKAGEQLSAKEGFAGHVVFSFNTRFVPKCFYVGKYDAMQQIQNPKDIFKRGHYIRINFTISGNKVAQNDRTNKPGVYLSPTLVEHVGYGPEITNGPDAATRFGQAPAPMLPPGASATPLAGAPGAPPQQMPGQMPIPGQMPPGAYPGVMPGAPPQQYAPQQMPGQMPPGAAPQQYAPPAGVPGAYQPPGVMPGQMPGAAPQYAAQQPSAMPGAYQQPGQLPPLPGAPGVLPPLPGPGAPAQPQYAMTAAAMGATREALLGQGWTDALLIERGYMVRTA